MGYRIMVTCSRCDTVHAAKDSQHEFVTGDNYCPDCRLVPRVLANGRFHFIRVGAR